MRMDGGSKCHLNRAMITLYDDQNIPSTPLMTSICNDDIPQYDEYRWPP